MCLTELPEVALPASDMWQDCQITLQHTRPCYAKSSYRSVNPRQQRSHCDSVEANHWLRSLESDATVPADYALTTTMRSLRPASLLSLWCDVMWLLKLIINSVHDFISWLSLWNSVYLYSSFLLHYSVYFCYMNLSVALPLLCIVVNLIVVNSRICVVIRSMHTRFM